MDDRNIMAGQTTAQRPQSAIEIAAREASQRFFGGLMDELLAGRKATSFRRGYVHAATGHHDFRGEIDAYDEGFKRGWIVS